MKASLSINMIIMFVIGLLVLIVVVAVFTNMFQKGGESAKACANAPGGKGECRPDCNEGEQRYVFGDEACNEVGDNYKCCVKI